MLLKSGQILVLEMNLGIPECECMNIIIDFFFHKNNNKIFNIYKNLQKISNLVNRHTVVSWSN